MRPLLWLVVVVSAHLGSSFSIRGDAPRGWSGVWSGRPTLSSQVASRPVSVAAAAGGEEDQGVGQATLDRIDKLVQEENVVVFIKGTALFPQCGFSSTVVQILDRMDVRYVAHDVLADDRIRQGVKEYARWPTIPQLYLCGEFIGGSDIVLELYQSGELLEMIEIAAAS